MFSIERSDQSPDFSRLEAELQVLQAELCCETETRPFQLIMTDDESPALFTLDRDRGVFVSTCQSEEICRYARIDRDTYFRLCGLLGRAQWTVLERNPLLVQEDLAHDAPSRCLFAHQPFKQDYALTLENPHLCRGCVEFYQCLGAESEILDIQALIEVIHTPFHPRN